MPGRSSQAHILVSVVGWPLKKETVMKIFLISSAAAIVIAVAAFYVLQSTGADTASAMSGAAVRL